MVIFWFLRHSKVIEKIIKILIYYSKIKKIKYKFKEKIVYKKMRKILFNKMLIMWKKEKWITLIIIITSIMIIIMINNNKI